ncbi:MAG: hypothetical protein AB2598_05305 [Candidatus Thiodiazotropha sp.]
MLQTTVAESPVSKEARLRQRPDNSLHDRQLDTTLARSSESSGSPVTNLRLLTANAIG